MAFEAGPARRRETSAYAAPWPAPTTRAVGPPGVEYQDSRETWPKAAEYFGAALTYHTNNPSAFVNQLYNSGFDGDRRSIMPSKAFRGTGSIAIAGTSS